MTLTLKLTPSETKIYDLLKSEERPFTYQELFVLLNGTDVPGTLYRDYLAPHFVQLRRKFGKEAIINHPGIGYSLAEYAVCLSCKQRLVPVVEDGEERFYGFREIEGKIGEAMKMILKNLTEKESEKKDNPFPGESSWAVLYKHESDQVVLKLKEALLWLHAAEISIG